MRKEIVYYAFDDTEFDSKQECEQYEKQFMVNLNDIIIFDEAAPTAPNPARVDELVTIG